MDAIIVTALETALAAAQGYISNAQAIKKANVSACVDYLRAAQSAITGLEDEADEILIEAKLVSMFYWEKRIALCERIERYLNRDRLRPLLDQAIQGIAACHEFAELDAQGFFGGAEKAEGAAEVKRLLKELSHYLESLGGAMKYNKQNYAGPSGRNMAELLDIQGFLSGKEVLAGQQTPQAAIAALAQRVQDTRERRGLPLVANASRIIQELTVVFGLMKAGAG